MNAPCECYAIQSCVGLFLLVTRVVIVRSVPSLSHGYQLANKKISAVSIFFETLPYRLNEDTGIIDYDMMEKVAALYRPKILLGGASAYSRHVDYGRMRKVNPCSCVRVCVPLISKGRAARTRAHTSRFNICNAHHSNKYTGKMIAHLHSHSHLHTRYCCSHFSSRCE